MGDPTDFSVFHGDNDGRVARVLMDSLPALVGYWDANLRNVAANAAYREYFGVEPEALYGRHLRELLGEELFAQNEPFVYRALAGEEQLFDRAITDPSGFTRYTQASYIPDIVDGHVVGFAVLVTDVTARRVAERAAQDAQARFRVLFDMAPIGTFLVTTDGRVVEANEAATDILGYAREQIVGMKLSDLHGPEDPFDADEIIRRLELSGAAQSVERQYRRADGSYLWAQLDARVVPTDVGGEHLVLGQLQDVTHRREEADRLRRLASRDPLTGLFNRRGLVTELTATASGAVILLDLDRFKLVNDELGHHAGDEVLVAIARLLEDCGGDETIVARLGGDEFAVLIPGASAEEACDVAATVRERVEAASLGVARSPVRASLGVGVFEPGMEPAAAMRAADHAMYDAKRQGIRSRQRSRPSPARNPRRRVA